MPQCCLDQDQSEADDYWAKTHQALSTETHSLLQQMEQEGNQQDQDMQEIAGLEDEMRSVQSTLHGHEASIALSAQEMNQIIEDCERDYVEAWAQLEVNMSPHCSPEGFSPKYLPPLCCSSRPLSRSSSTSSA